MSSRIPTGCSRMAGLGRFGPKGLRLHFLQRGCAGRGGAIWAAVPYGQERVRCSMRLIRHSAFQHYHSFWCFMWDCLGTLVQGRGQAGRGPQFSAALTWSMHANVLSGNVTVPMCYPACACTREPTYGTHEHIVRNLASVPAH